MATYPGRDIDRTANPVNKWQVRVHTKMRCGTNVSSIATKPHLDKAEKEAIKSYRQKTEKHLKSCQVCKEKGY